MSWRASFRISLSREVANDGADRRTKSGGKTLCSYEAGCVCTMHDVIIAQEVARDLPEFLHVLEEIKDKVIT